MEPSKNGLWTFYTWAEWEVLANQAELTPSLITFKRNIRRVICKKGKQLKHPIHKIAIIECPICEKMVKENQDESETLSHQEAPVLQAYQQGSQSPVKSKNKNKESKWDSKMDDYDEES